MMSRKGIDEFFSRTLKNAGIVEVAGKACFLY